MLQRIDGARAAKNEKDRCLGGSGLILQRGGQERVVDPDLLGRALSL